MGVVSWLKSYPRLRFRRAMTASIIFDKREKAREDNTILEGSKVIDDFLKFLRDAKMDYAVSQDIETEAEKETRTFFTLLSWMTSPITSTQDCLRR